MPWQWPWTRHDRALWQVGDMPAASTYAAVPVNPTTAMQHSAVWACVDLIASAISTLPLYAYRRGDRDPLPDLPPILRQPSATMNLPDWLYAALQSLLLRGNCYGLIVDRAGAGLLPAQVELLAPDRVQVTANGSIEYRVDGQEVDPASIWHVKAYTSAGNVVGLSPIAYARQAIGLGMAAEKFAAQFFGDSAIPTGIITTDQQIHHSEASALKERWAAVYGRPWSHRNVAVLGGGAKFQAITIPPRGIPVPGDDPRQRRHRRPLLPRPTRADRRRERRQPHLRQCRAAGPGLPPVRPGALAGASGDRHLGPALVDHDRQVQRRSAGPYRPAYPVPGPRERHPGRLEAPL
jgi:hypothetical protein